MKLYNNSKLVIDNVKAANNFSSRFIGLLGRKDMDENEGILLIKCSSIHCFFMKFAIDVVYLSKEMKVLYKETVKPWRIGKLVKNTCHILELKEDKAKEINVGDSLDFVV